MAAPNKKHDRPTTGHSWDGIEEFDNPMPRWWLWTFYISIIWAVIYMIFYPAWPLINSATSGILGYSSRADVAAEIADADAANQVWYDRLTSTDLNAIADDAELQRFAVNAGAAVFRAQCSQCHGAGAAGVVGAGFPNLLMIGGPGSPSVLVNVIMANEYQVGWIAGLIQYMRDKGYGRFDVDPREQEKWAQTVQDVIQGTVLTSANSWYVGANVPGKARGILAYAGGITNYTSACDKAARNGFEGFVFS